MIPSARFGDIRIIDTYEDKVICSLYSLYENGIENVASNKAFCLFLLTELHHKLSLHDSQVMSWNGATSREKAKSLYEKLDETSHVFYKESRVLLRGTRKVQGDQKGEILPDEERFEMIASKVIGDFEISDIETMDETFWENAILEFSVTNIQLVAHMTEGLLVEC